MKIPPQYNQLMPYLIVRTASEFLEFSKMVFGAEEQLTVPNADASVMHAELRIGQAVIMYADATETYKETCCSLCLMVENVNETYAKAMAHGAASLQEPTVKDYGMMAGFRDKFSNTWWLMEGMK